MLRRAFARTVYLALVMAGLAGQAIRQCIRSARTTATTSRSRP
jgi:hypothetical protein